MSSAASRAAEVLAFALATALILLGLAGVFLPLLPGAPLILLAAVVHKLLAPGYLGAWTLAALTGLALLAALAEAALAWAGARWLGAGGYGIAGAGVGALLGLLWGGLGLLPGAVLGAALAEWWLARRTPPEAARAALGAAMGLLAGRAAQAGISVFMAVLIVLDWFLY
ncbi:MAG: DUF456 family protein [Elusimicrobia bacterium]|nr:DUF456 family protein [Elusimicrobiota bacterium]